MAHSSRFETVYAWVCPLPGEGIVAAGVERIGMAPLVTLDEDKARGSMASLAHMLAQATGRPLQLMRWSAPEILESIDVG